MEKGLGMTRQNHKRGFSLIEAAIVLAVVGGVIGGIWVSADNVRENYKINQLTDGLILAASLLRGKAETL